MQREFKVGVLSMAALLVAALALLLLGGRSNLFVRENRYSIRFAFVGGLAAESPVQLNGVNVGRVRDVVLPEKIEEELLTVWISIDRRYAERVRRDSVARIKTLGLLGDKFVEISSGSPEAERIPSGGEIPAAAPTDVDRLIASGEDVVENVVAISASLRTVLTRIEAGEGVIGELLRETEESARARDSLIGTLESVHEIADRIESGQGTLGRLVNDQAVIVRFEEMIDRLEKVASSFEGGEGPMAALLHDAELKAALEGSVSSISGAADGLSDFATELQEGGGLLQRLISDREYAEAVSRDLRRLLENLEKISSGLERGEGTIGQLLEDPSLYEAVNDVVVGVEESWLLRWLIRNRQKKGIRERYEDRVEEMETGDEPSVPPSSEPRPAGGSPG